MPDTNEIVGERRVSAYFMPIVRANPSEDRARLGQAKIVVTNFHSFLACDRSKAARVTKQILAQGCAQMLRALADAGVEYAEEPQLKRRCPAL